MTDRRREILLFAVLGVISGAITTGALFMLPLNWQFEMPDLLMISPLSIYAGLVFGIIFGAVLKYRGLAATRTAVLYALASTAAYFVAVNLAFHVFAGLENIWLTGMIAGLFGSACLTGISTILFPFIRQPRAVLLMLTAGCVLGGALYLTNYGFWTTLLFFALWQAGYAAAFATALPKTAGGA